MASPGATNSLGANKAIVIDNTAPSTPSGLSATSGSSSITLTWSANSESDLASYKVYGGTSASPTTLLSTISSGTETYTHSSLIKGTTYYYRISAVDNAGNESSKSNDVSATIPDRITTTTTFEHDTFSGMHNSIAHVSGNVYVVAYQGSGEDGYIKTIIINDDSTITQTASSEHDTGHGKYNSIVKVSGTLYALAYTGSNDYGKIKTFTISDDGSNIETNGILEHDNSTTMWNSLVRVSMNTIALAYDSNNPTGGVIKTFTISGSGAIITEVQSLEHDTNFGLCNSLIKMDAETYALAYSGNGWDGYISTFAISADGSSITLVDQIEHNTSFAQHNSLVQVDYNTYALAYYGSDGGNFGLIQTFTIPLNGYGITKTASLKHETNTNTGTYNSFIKLNSGEYALAYTGYENDGYIKIFNISSDGETITEASELEFDYSNGTWNDLIFIDKNTCALAYCGEGSDGYIQTFNIEADDAAGPAYAVTIDTNNDSVTVVFNEHVYSTNAGTGQLTADNFSFSISGGVAGITSSPTGITKDNGYIFFLGTDISGTADGTEVLTVNLANTVYDANGNAASAVQSNNTVTLNKKVPLTIATTTLAPYNTTIDVTFSEEAYSSFNNGTGISAGALDTDDFIFSITGGEATLGSTTPSSITTESFTNLGYFNGHYYYRSNSQASWTNAKIACENAGGYLAVITSAGENKLIHENISSDSWIGFSDEATEGTWVSVTGETVSYTNWGSGEPNSSGDGCQIKTSGSWDDTGINNSKYYILEITSPITNVYTLGINYSGLPNGYEVLTVNPSENAIYDRSGNIAGTDQSNNQLTFAEEKIREVTRLEHNNHTGTYNSIVKIDDDTYAVAYAGRHNDGFIQTFTIPADGSSITAIKYIEHDYYYGRWNSFLKIDEDTYALAYAGNGDDGYIQTFTIPADGSTITTVDLLRQDYNYGAFNSLIQLGSDTYVLAYLGRDNDGWIKIFTITTDGTIAQISELEHDTDGGSYNSLVKVDSNTVALAYSGSSGNGYIKTFDILIDSSITQVNSYRHDATKGNHNSFVQADANTYVLAYGGADDDGFISTFTINSSGVITPVKTKMLGNNLEHDTKYYFTLSPSALSKISGSSDSYILAYGGEDTDNNDTPDGYIKTFTISNDGSAITQTYILEHDIELATNTSLVQMDDDTYALAYSGGEGHASWDGYVKTFSVRGTAYNPPPDTPSGLAAIPGNSRVILTWSANGDSDLVSYKVYGGTGTSPSSLLSTVSAGTESYSHTGLTNGTTYYYRISAVDNAGNESSKTGDVSAIPIPQRYTVKTDGSGDFTVIQTAINATTTGDTVLVSPGTYTENINYSGKNIVVGSLFLTTKDTSYISSTIIDGNQAASVVIFENGEGPTALLTGFTITNGLGTGYPIDTGGGITIKKQDGQFAPVSSPTITNVIISGNVGTGQYHDGGGVYIAGDCSATITNVTISGNSTNNNGGGISCRGGSLTLTNAIIRGNVATGDGGGGLIIANVEENGNPSATLTNVTIVDNTTNKSGGGIQIIGASPILTNVTISNNTAGQYGGGIYINEAGSHPNILNSILWDNTANTAAGNTQEIFVLSGSVTATYSDIQGGWEGTGNIDSNPLFVDASNGDYRLSDYSPSIGAGIATGAPSTDIDGNPRPNPEGSSPDMGAYENALPSRLPKAGVIADGLSTDVDWWNSESSLSANWVPFTDNDTVTYEYAIGSNNIDDVLSWTSTGSDTTATISGLSLTEGETYSVSVRATDTDNQLSDTTTTDGVTIDITAPVISSVAEGSETGSNNTYSLSFDGVDDYVSVNGTVIDNVFSGTQAFTIALWVYGDGGGNDGIYKSFINKGNTFSSNGNPSTFMLLKQSVGTITCILFTDANNWIGLKNPKNGKPIYFEVPKNTEKNLFKREMMAKLRSTNPFVPIIIKSIRVVSEN